MARIEAIGVTKRYVQGALTVEALRDATLTVDAGEAVAVVGPSGAGKSTLLHLLGAMDVPTSGSVSVDGVDTATQREHELTVLRRRSIGFVFQHSHLLPSLRAVDNVAVPLLLDGVAVGVARAAAEAALERVDLGSRIRHRPGELSGGEQQRVAIARALVTDPPIVLADEPTGNLDSTSSAATLEVLLAATADVGRSLVVVTHDLTLARRCERTVELRDGVLSDALPSSP